ncbi:MAG TPA: HAD family phosphatase [Acidothermaceae bacterium]|nr:HAD family phosphatase [Acidothermaceae bacterium]
MSLPAAVPGRSRLPAAVLFDMDGLLIDTEPLWFSVETDILNELGASWTHDDHASLVGSSLKVASQFVSTRAGGSVTAEQVSEQLLLRMRERLRHAPVLKPGVVDLITELDGAGVPRALVSSSFGVLVEAALEGLAPLTFDTVVVGDEVSDAKPHPEPYLLGASKLGVDPADCVAFEDSPSGAASASAAGCFVIAIPSVAPIEPAQRRIVRPSLVGLDLKFLRSLFD